MSLLGYSTPETLTDDAGNALKGITVTVTGPSSYSGSAVTDSTSGVLRLGPLPVGDYTVTLGSRSVTVPVLAGLPAGGSDGQVVTQTSGVPGWSTPTGGGGTAATTTFTPTGSIAATNVQAALAEVATEYAAADTAAVATAAGDATTKANAAQAAAIAAAATDAATKASAAQSAATSAAATDATTKANAAQSAATSAAASDATSKVAAEATARNAAIATASATSVTLTGDQTVAGNKTFSGTTSGITKGMVGLGNVDNTSDANKPVSTAQATADALALAKASNLSDLASAATARTNLGLGGAALLAVGTTAGTVAAGDDSRILPPGPALNVYSPYLAKYRRGLSKVRAGTADCKILLIGDSTTAGGGVNTADVNNLPIFLRSLLNSYYIPAVDGAIWGLSPSASITDARITVGSGWSGGSAAGGIGGGFQGNTGGGNLSFTFAHSIDTIDVYYLKNGSLGTVTVNVDGGASLGTINTSGTQGVGKSTVSCTAGVHTVNITSPTVATVFILGIEASLSTGRRVRVSNGGYSGTTAAGWANASSGLPGTGFQSQGASFAAYVPDLTIISLGINDAGASSSAATYQTNMQSIITSAKAVSDVLLCAPLGANGTPYTTLVPQYLPVLKALAVSNNVPLLDMTSRWVDYTTSNALGYFADGIHPAAFGYADWAQAVFNVLKTV